MYDNQLSRRYSACRAALVTATATAVVLALGAFVAAPAMAQVAQVTDPSSVIRKISGLSDKLELTTNSSRILTLDKNIPRVQVNNPELLAVTPLSATQVQISAKKAGVTQVNLWDEDGNIHSVDVQIYGDARELQVALHTQFPNATIKVYRYSESLVLTGFVDRPDHISPIMALAQDYAPKVINNITVGGVQQVLLKVKVMEVSRTKLRDLGVDWAVLNGQSILAASNVSGLLQPAGSIISNGGNLVKVGGPIGSGGQTFQFGVFNGNGSFLAFLNALEECRAARIMAEPNIVAISGRPAQFQAGGEFPVLIPQSLGTTSIEYKPYGTQVDFIPIVLGNGNIRLEVRPRISDVDPTLSVILNGNNIPALTVRQVDTAVEMKAGQTFALGGLIQQRTETLSTGLPYLSDVPVIGVPFRRTRDKVNEIELLVIVTPEFVDPIDAGELACDGGPGTCTTSPTNRGLYCGGQMEVPTYCNPRQSLSACGCDDCNSNGGCQSCNSGQGNMPMNSGPAPMLNGNVVLPGGTGYDDTSNAPTTVTDQPQQVEPLPPESGPQNGSNQAPADGPTPPQSGVQNQPEDITLPVVGDDQFLPSEANATTPAGEAGPSANFDQPAADATQGPAPNDASSFQPVNPFTPTTPQIGQGGMPTYTAPRPYSPQRQPVFMRNALKSYNPQSSQVQPAPSQPDNSLIGPVGYDVQ